MSSWGRGVKLYRKSKETKKTIGYYYDVSNTQDIANTYLELLGAYIYSRKLNDVCNVYDPNGFISASIRYSPQLNVLKEVPEDTDRLSLNSIIQITQNLPFSEIQKFASSLFEYTPEFNRGILQVLDKAAIRNTFDIAIHITDNTPDSFEYYLNILSEYQKKSKKARLNIYIMSENYEMVMDFQKMCNPSWKITSLSKFNVSDIASLVFQQLAEVQIFAVVEATSLDFSNSLDRFIYIMQRKPKVYTFFKELSNTKWSIEGPMPLRALVASAPAQAAAAQAAAAQAAAVQAAVQAAAAQAAVQAAAAQAAVEASAVEAASAQAAAVQAAVEAAAVEAASAQAAAVQAAVEAAAVEAASAQAAAVHAAVQAATVQAAAVQLQSQKALAEAAAERVTESLDDLRKELSLTRNEASSLTAKVDELSTALAEQRCEVGTLILQLRQVSGLDVQQILVQDATVQNVPVQPSESVQPSEPVQPSESVQLPPVEPSAIQTDSSTEITADQPAATQIDQTIESVV